MNYKIVYLAGFMGAGKSTIGPILANTLGWDFFDLDHVIEGRAGKKVRQIFEDSGENYFRELETQTLTELSLGYKKIIALGGGTIVNIKNREIIKANGITVYLKTTPEKVYERLKNKRDRPILLKPNGESLPKDQLLAKIKALFESRREFYEQADYVIDTDKTTIGKTIDIIAHHITKGTKQE